MPNLINLEDVNPRLSFSDEQTRIVEDILRAGNADFTGADIWNRLNREGYVIIPASFILHFPFK